MRKLVVAIIAIIAIIAGCGSLWALLGRAYLAAAALHMLSAVCGVLVAGAPLGRNAYLLTVAMGVPGVGGIMAVMHHYESVIAARQDIARDFENYIDASQRLGDFLMPRTRAKYQPDPGALESMADILRSSAPVRDKRLAIEALAQMESPQSVQVLRSVLTASSIEVRFYAASVLARLEERLAQRLSRLEQDIALGRRVGDDAVISLAQSYFDYAYYGLAEGSRARDLLELALERLREIGAKEVGPRVLLLHGRVLLKLVRFQEAEECFTKYIESSKAKQPGFLWRAEARMFQGNFQGVADDCLAAISLGEIPRRLVDAVNAWLTPDRLQKGAS